MNRSYFLKLIVLTTTRLFTNQPFLYQMPLGISLSSRPFMIPNACSHLVFSQTIHISLACH